VYQICKPALKILFLYAIEIYAVYYSAINQEWWLLVLAIGIGWLHSVVLFVGMHRLFSHRQFQTQRWKEIILAFWCILPFQGSAIGWSKDHALHHKYSDSNKDVHSPEIFGFWSVIFHLYTFESGSKKNARLEGEYGKPHPALLADPVQIFIHQYYYRIWMGLLLLFFIVGGAPMVVFGLLVPAAVTHHVSGLINSLGHKHGYRNHNTIDKSSNSWIANLFLFGEGYHNNHHKNWKKLILEDRPGEFDLVGRFIQKFLAIKD